jgi:hypothetical protein
MDKPTAVTLNNPLSPGFSERKATLSAFVYLSLSLALIHAQDRVPPSAPGLKVQGNQLITITAGTLGVEPIPAGVPVVLRGVNFSGSEYACLGGSFWANQPGNQATLDAMLTWHANVMRLPLNEECWLGINHVPAASSGPKYRKAIGTFVKLANASGLIVEVNLHFGAGGRALPKNDDYPALDVDHAPAFWQFVAQYFKGNSSVLFNLINEPHDLSWSCLRNGGCHSINVPGVGSWKVVGTQSIVTRIRSTGAANPIIVAGLDWSDDLTQWLHYVPADPLHQIIAGFHTYAPPLDNFCTTAKCWNEVLAPIQAAGYPLIIDEFGETDCDHDYVDKLMDWADAQSPQMGYWGWDWTTYDCASEPALLKDSFGTPTQYGVGLRNRLLSIQ